METNVDLDSAALPSTRYVDRGDNAVAVLDNLLQIGLHLLPRVKPSIPNSLRTLNAIRRSVVVLERAPLDVGMEGVPEDVGVVHERLHPLVHEFDVLLRHQGPVSPRRFNPATPAGFWFS